MRKIVLVAALGAVAVFVAAVAALGARPVAAAPQRVTVGMTEFKFASRRRR